MIEPERQITVFELEFRADDKAGRKDIHGKPMYSREAVEAMRAGVEAFRAEMAKQGYLGSPSYGMRVEQYDGPAL